MRQNELYHYGVLGMKWGIRRYQNADGTLTAAGKKRLRRDEARLNKRAIKQNIRELNFNNLEKQKRGEGPLSYARWLSSDATKQQLRYVKNGNKRVNNMIAKLSKEGYILTYDTTTGMYSLDIKTGR